MGWWQQLQHFWQRRQHLNRGWRDHRYIALDVETSGLDARRDQVLAIGWIEVTPPVMDFQHGQYFVTQSAPELKQSPVVHGLVRRDFASAEAPEAALRALAEVLEGAVLVCHHVQFDWQFLQRFARQYKVRLRPLAKFDTLTFEARRLRLQQHHIARGSLTLKACRSRFGLPDYQAHHAFSDAIACGELFLAQAYQYAGRTNAPLKELLK
ncbi:3'-5' exonuclease [Pseudidiomarina insulisalsae]|uniref:3'-5' exonuclease n=1 Tax=Pseudidiomarina insulisalsae TaxID=575789 RepID=A0A432YLK1_9GAMM|nr:3'-5' exonuclease [Pseudidiomarina insulisalsae]RUO61826.1 3'-5' exonuclease [Pseudidiomarina insulisalsae]